MSSQSQAPALSLLPRGFQPAAMFGNHLVQGMSLQRPGGCLQGTKTERPQGAISGGFPKHRDSSRLLEFVKSGPQIKCSQNSKARKTPLPHSKVIPPFGRHLV